MKNAASGGKPSITHLLAAPSMSERGGAEPDLILLDRAALRLPKLQERLPTPERDQIGTYWAIQIRIYFLFYIHALNCLKRLFCAIKRHMMLF